MENAPSPLAPGRPFGGAFTLLRPLGSGGAAGVWLAREDALGREVALKIPARADPAARGRFLGEARALAAVRHPGVVPVLRWGEDPATGLPFFAMPAYPATLADLFARQPRLPEADAAELGLALVPALAALHAAGLAHRDLKPSNVLLDASGAPVLADPCGPRGGTPAWAAPEQLAGKNDNSALAPVGGAAADWHARGLLLYRALAGALPPPRGILPVAVEPPRGSLPRDLRPRPSRGWEPLLCALLDPDPETRLADPSAILRILRRLRRRALLRARLHRLLRPALFALAALLALVLLARCASGLAHSPAPAPEDAGGQALRDAIGNEERPLARLQGFLDAALRNPAPGADGIVRVADGAVLFAEDLDGIPASGVLLDGGTLFFGPRKASLEALAASWRERAGRLRETGDPGVELPPLAEPDRETGTRFFTVPVFVGANGGVLVAYDEFNDITFCVTGAIRRAPGVERAELRCDGFSNLILARGPLDPGLAVSGFASVADFLPDGRVRNRRWFDPEEPL